MRKVLLGRKITAARGADPGIGDPDRHAGHSPQCTGRSVVFGHIVVTLEKDLSWDSAAL
jgi:hypothetical protein